MQVVPGGGDGDGQVEGQVDGGAGGGLGSVGERAGDDGSGGAFQAGLPRPGPEPLRSRVGRGRFGLDGLSAEEQLKVHQDSALWLMPMVLFEVAREARSEKGWMVPAFVQENPRDPKEWLGTGENGKGTKQPELGWATFWAWPETEQFAARNQMLVAKLDQGPLGHERRKPTTLLTNQVEVMALHGVAGPGDQTGRSGTVEDRIKESSMWAAWAPKLKEAIKASLQRVNRETLEEVRVKAARRPTRDEQWRMHVENEHVPHRRDCRVCMEAAGRAGAHRRIRAPNAFVMSVDILGPTREGGDQDGAKAKYAVVTVLTVPVKKSSGEPLVMLGEEEEVEGAGEGGLDLHPEEEELPRGPEELPVEEEDLFAEQEERGSAPGEEGRVEVEKAEEETRKWKEKIKDLEDVAVRNLTFAIPIRSRNRDVVLQAVAECYSRYKALGCKFCGCTRTGPGSSHVRPSGLGRRKGDCGAR